VAITNWFPSRPRATFRRRGWNSPSSPKRWTELYRTGQRSVPISLSRLAEGTGLSKSAVQSAVRLLKRRGLVKINKRSATAVPEYELVRHGLSRRAKSRVTTW